MASSARCAFLVGEEGSAHAPHRLRGREVLGHRAGEEVDEPVDAEQVTHGRARLGDAVGVEQHLVTGFELVGAHGVAVVGVAEPEPEGQAGVDVQAADELPLAQQQRFRMTGVDPGQVAGTGVELGEDGGGVGLRSRTPPRRPRR